jgi:hypothetical protein
MKYRVDGGGSAELSVGWARSGCRKAVMGISSVLVAKSLFLFTLLRGDNVA